jgi:hypothetical protein
MRFDSRALDAMQLRGDALPYLQYPLVHVHPSESQGPASPLRTAFGFVRGETDTGTPGSSRAALVTHIHLVMREAERAWPEAGCHGVALPSAPAGSR